MKVSVLCTRLIIHVLMLLDAADQHSADAAILHVDPNRLQFFEYDSIVLDCDGFDDFTQWRVMRIIKGVTTICGSDSEISRQPCFIQNAFKSDSGDYWCEANSTVRSNSVKITVTDGPVILQSPTPPVTEGETVTLSCKTKASSVHIADFYKDGILTSTGYHGNTTIPNVSASDEGLYKCNILGVGESAESWLVVGVSPPLHEDARPSRRLSLHLIIQCFIVVMAALALLLLMFGLCLCRKFRVFDGVSSKSSVPTHWCETVSGLPDVVHPENTFSGTSANTSYKAESGLQSFTGTPTSACTDQSVYYYTID